jgi:hypothetical protein
MEVAFEPGRDSGINSIFGPGGGYASIRSLALDGCFIHEHHRYVILDGIDTMAFLALEARLIGLEMNRRFVEGANKNFQQFRTDRHEVAPRGLLAHTL